MTIDKCPRCGSGAIIPLKPKGYYSGYSGPEDYQCHDCNIMFYEDASYDDDENSSSDEVHDSSNINEIVVTLKIPKQYYEAGLVVSRLLDFKSFSEYAEYAVKESIEMEVNGRGDIDYNSNKSALDKVHIPRIHPKER